MNRTLAFLSALGIAAGPGHCSERQQVLKPERPQAVRPERPQGSAEGVQVRLWPTGLKLVSPSVERAEHVEVRNVPRAGPPVTWIFDVTQPTMTVYRPRTGNSGAAVLVFPGGGYEALAVDLEGTEICDWLTRSGITCAVLKYRVPGSGPHWSSACKCQRVPEVPMALQDAQRAMVILRARASEFGIDKAKIGVLGASAGGHLVAAISNAEKLAYAPIDVADTQSSRPNFAIALYPGHLWSGTALELYKFNPISAKAPPTFILHAQDDPVDDVRNSLAYFLALTQAKVPVDMHIYSKGGHGFGLRRTKKPITDWTRLADKWLRAIGVLNAPQ